MSSLLTVRLPGDLDDRALNAAARRRQRKNSDVARLALREFLGTSGGRRGRPIARVRALLDSLESGIPDLADRHRDYLLESVTGHR